MELPRTHFPRCRRFLAIWSHRCCRKAHAAGGFRGRESLRDIGVVASREAWAFGQQRHGQKGNLICHIAPRRLNDKDTRNTIASHIADLARLLSDDQKADRSHWTRLVKLWNECGSYLEDMRKSAPEASLSPVQDASRFLVSPPQNAKEKEEFTQALETGLFQDELNLLSREGGPRRQDTPRRMRESTRSDPFDGVPSTRKMDLTPSLSSFRPRKRQK